MNFFRIALCAALFVASVAMGQTKPGDIVVDVPFPFVAGGQTLHAGHYIVAAMDDTVRLFNSQTSGIFLPTHSASRNTSDGTKLVFHRYGDTYFLSAMWIGGNAIGRELPRSKAERELASRTAEMELAEVRPDKVRPAK